MSPTQAPPDTREKFIASATRLFADMGFYGASMDRIAGEVGLTKQALIHHFRSKEKLYGAVLQDISERLLSDIGLATEGEPPNPRPDFAEAITRIYQRSLDEPQETQLLMRELLDNRRRANTAGVWYLRPFLDHLVAALGHAPGWQHAADADRAVRVYQLLGAINYFCVSQQTLEHMYSRSHFAKMREQFPEQLRQLALASLPGIAP